MGKRYITIPLVCMMAVLALGSAIFILRAPLSSAANIAVRLIIPSPTCGNGILEGDAEQCDDGNLINGDGCDEFCYFEVCGNGIKQFGEECDDANTNNNDGCLNDCTLASCGDGYLRTGVEQCDDGNLINGDGCDNQCYFEVCGNGRVQFGEGCDDGNANDGDGCSAVCSVEPGYVCTGSPSCCSVCGDGVVTCSEECDDGKHCQNGFSCVTDAECFGIGDNFCSPRDGDGCSATCKNEVGTRPPARDIIISQITAYPEQRSGAAGTNYDAQYYFSVLTPDNLNHQTLYSHPSLLNTNNSGIGHPYVILGNFSEGTYDMTFKSSAHLKQLLDNVYLKFGENQLNFTNAANLPQIGPLRLIAGDIDNSGASPSSLGDDVINSIDLSILLQSMGQSDPTGNAIRANLNQDGVVDMADLNILLGNLDKEAGF